MRIKRRGWRYISIIGCLCLFWATQAVAVESPFTIKVPVELRDMHPDIESGEINCSVRDAQETPIAGGTVSFGIDRKTRSFANTITVPTQLASGRSPADARTYQCVLILKDIQANRGMQPGSLAAQGNSKFEPAPGTPFMPLVSGQIPSTLQTAPLSVKPIRNTGTLK